MTQPWIPYDWRILRGLLRVLIAIAAVVAAWLVSAGVWTLIQPETIPSSLLNGLLMAPIPILVGLGGWLAFRKWTGLLRAGAFGLLVGSVLTLAFLGYLLYLSRELGRV